MIFEFWELLRLHELINIYIFNYYYYYIFYFLSSVVEYVWRFVSILDTEEFN